MLLQKEEEFPGEPGVRLQGHHEARRHVGGQ